MFAFAKLRSLTKLKLDFNVADACIAASVVDALVSLTGLAELDLQFQSSKRTILPAAMGQLKGLRSLSFHHFIVSLRRVASSLPNLLSLTFWGCGFLECRGASGRHCSAEPHKRRVHVLPGTALFRPAARAAASVAAH